MLAGRLGLRVTKKAPSILRPLPWRAYASTDCWNCGEDLAKSSSGAVSRKHASLFFSCECGAIQPVDSQTSLFDLFGLPQTIEINARVLETRFRDLQRLLHPDRFAQRGVREREISAANSALVNKAYQTLRRPMERLRYVLAQEGSLVLEEGGGTVSDPGFLMEIMEVREQIAESTSEAELKGLGAVNSARISESLAAVARHFARRDIAALGEEAVRLQYFTKVEEDILEAADVR